MPYYKFLYKSWMNLYVLTLKLKQSIEWVPDETKFVFILIYIKDGNILFQNSYFQIMNPQPEPIYTGPPMQTMSTVKPVDNKSSASSTLRNRNNVIFAVAIILYEILALPIYGVLFRLSDSLTLYQDQGGLLIVSIASIFILIGMGLINGYVIRSSFTGVTYTLVIFALTTQHFFLFRAFWNKAGTNDYDNSAKTFDSWYDKVTLSNFLVDRQYSTHLPSGPFVQAIACSISMAVAFNPVVGRIGLLQIFVLTFLGSFFYEVNAELIYRWFITDNGFGCRIFLFGSIVGLITSILLGKKQTTINHISYQSHYRIMSYSLLGFLFLFISMPMLSGISVFSRTTFDNAILYASHINAWLAVFASVLGTFTASAFLYRKFSLHDLVFTGTAGAVSLAMEADICFNPCVPLIVGYIVGFGCSIYPAALNRKINAQGVLLTYSHINRFFIPAILSTIVSAIVQACAVSQNGDHTLNILTNRTSIQQGGWQIVGLVITLATAGLAGIIIGVAYKVLNNNRSEDQFNDQTTYSSIPQSMYQLD